MPQNAQRTEFVDMLPEWSKAVDFSHSEKRVHEGTTKYLPRLISSANDPDDVLYTAYLKRAALSMFLKKVVKTYVGMASRKKVDIADSDSITDYLVNVTGTGKSFDSYIAQVEERFFTTGRCGTLIDLPAGETNSNPMFLMYTEDNIPYWNEGIVDGVSVLTQVILIETVLVDNGNKFETETESQYRVLELIDGVYTVGVYNESGVLVGEELTPKMNNSTLDYIPFLIHGGNEVKPPFLTEIVDQNLHHYQLNADHYHGLHWCGLPTPYDTSGGEPPKTIGPTTWLTFDNDTTVGFLEFEGKGLGEIADKLKVIEDTISTLAVNMITDDSSRTATQVNIDDSNHSASLAGAVDMLSSEFTVLLGWSCAWMAKECGAVKINTDFVSKKMVPEMLTALMNARLSGGMSLETYLWNIEQGELLPETTTIEDEQSAIETELPAGMVGGAE